MKKAALLLCCILALSLLLYGQTTSSGTELVLLLDGSQSMFPHFSAIVETIVPQIITQYLRFGDSFHVLSFSDTTSIELSLKLHTEQDLRAAISRLYLLYPFGTSTDIITALRNAYQFMFDLPLSNRKTLVLITDGFHAPPAQSPFAQLDTTAVGSEITRLAGQYREQGWDLRIISVPMSESVGEGVQSSVGGSSPAPTSQSAQSVTGGQPSTAGTPTATGVGAEDSSAPGAGYYLDQIASAMNTTSTEFNGENAENTVRTAMSLPGFSLPEDSGRHHNKFRLRISLNNPTEQTLGLELLSLVVNGTTDVLVKRQLLQLTPGKTTELTVPVAFPVSWPREAALISVEPHFADQMRVNPPIVHTRLEIKPNPILDFFGNSVRIFMLAGLIALLSAAVIVVALLGRSIHRRTDANIVDSVLGLSQEDSLEKKQIAPPVATEPIHGNSVTVPNTAVSTRPLGLASSIAATAYKSGSNTTGMQTDRQHKGSPEDNSRRSGQDALHTRNHDLLSKADRKTGNPSVLGLKNTKQGRNLSSQTHTVHNAGFKVQTIRPGTIMVECIVEGQNRAVGRRNIKILHAGGKKTIGGSIKDDFLVFLLPVPSALAELWYDGTTLLFVPKKISYIADHGSEAFPLAFGERVCLRSQKGKPLYLYILRYTPPAEKINNLLHCIEMPGKLGL